MEFARLNLLDRAFDEHVHHCKLELNFVDGKLLKRFEHNSGR